VLDLSPSEFATLTFEEFGQLVTGYQKRFELTREREAHWVAALMNATGNFKKPITVDQLIGRRPGEEADAGKASLNERADAARRARIEERRRRAAANRRGSPS